MCVCICREIEIEREREKKRRFMLRNWFIDWSVKSEICMAKQKAEDAGSILCVVLRQNVFLSGNLSCCS